MPHRKRRATLSAANEVGGCLWLVSSEHSDHHVIAKDLESAVATYHAIPSVSAATAVSGKETEVREVRWVANCVFGMPVLIGSAS